MAPESRRLAAIMFTDIAAYTALMGRDERKALSVLGRSRELLKEVIPKFSGRLIEEVGDGTLSSFQSAVEAVSCALEVKDSLKDDPDLRLRIGIHIGDVLFSDDRVLGDVVNVASRIHSLAEPGGICVSERVYDDIRNQPGMQATSLGQRSLKNASRPIRVFTVVGRSLAAEAAVGTGERGAPRAPIASAADLTQLPLSGRTIFVGRERERAQLLRWLDQASGASWPQASISRSPRTAPSGPAGNPQRAM